MKTSDQLREAAIAAKRLNHCKGQLWEGPRCNPTGCCIRGALILGGGDWESGNARDILKHILQTDYIAASFNDNENTTKAQVVQALDAGYILALQEEGIEPYEVLG